jgi:uncharacterized protein (TIGR00369 family)
LDGVLDKLRRHLFLSQDYARVVNMNAADNGFNALLGIQLRGVRGDCYELDLDVAPRHLHAAGRVHGGVYLALLDTVMARASRIGIGDEIYVPTLEIKVNFFRPLAAGKINATGRVVNRSRRTCYVEGELSDTEGRLLARGSATMILVE